MITFTGVVLNLDGKPDSQGDIFDENSAIELPAHDVSVTHEFDKRPGAWLGLAKLFFRPDKLCYTMRLDETKLSKEFLEKLVPCIGGSCKRSEGYVKVATITSIALRNFNADSRIKSLGEQNENNNDNVDASDSTRRPSQ